MTAESFPLKEKSNQDSTIFTERAQRERDPLDRNDTAVIGIFSGLTASTCFS
jgi:hypothetical protein